MIEKLFEGCENLGWSVSEDQEAGTVELESYSPAGENLVVTVEKENFSEKVREYAEDFDIDEHIEMWVEVRNNGVAGVPKSTRELVEDAERIKEMLLQLADALHEIEVNESVRERACGIVEQFDNLLHRKGIRVPCADEDEESQRNEDPDNEAALYGEEYWNLVNYIETVLRTLLHDSKEKAGEE